MSFGAIIALEDGTILEGNGFGIEGQGAHRSS